MSSTKPYSDYMFLSSDDSWGDKGRPDELKEANNPKEDADTFDFMNLCLYVHAAIVKNIQGNSEAQARYNENVVTSGSGVGIDDMAEILTYLKSPTSVPNSAFIEHELTSFLGRPAWLDRDFTTYRPSKHSVWPTTRGNVIAPEAFANYMTALSAETSDFLEESGEMIKTLRTTLQSVEEKRWSDVKEATDSLKKLVGRTQFVLAWMAEDINFRALPAEKLDIPDVLSATRQSEIMSAYSSLGEIRKAEALLSKVTTVAGLVDKIDSIGKAALLVTDFQTKGGLSEEEAIALAGLHHALGYLPVLGTLYQNVIEGFCGFLPEYRKIVADKQRVATDVIGFLKERHGQ